MTSLITVPRSTTTSAQRGSSSIRGGASKHHPLRHWRASRSLSSRSGEITRAAYVVVDRARASMPAMTKASVFAALFVVAAAGSARAGGQAGSIGVGAEYMLNGAGGPSLNYDGGQFHL